MPSARDWTDCHIPALTGPRILVTGADGGFGFEAARLLSMRGAEVVLGCRDPQRGAEAAERIRDAAPGAQVQLLTQPRVVTFSSGMHRAGRMDFDDLNWRTRRYHPWKAYGQTKPANLLFTFELQRRSTGAGLALDALAADPGYAATNLQRRRPRTHGSSLRELLAVAGNRVFSQDAVHGALPTVAAAAQPQAQGGDYWGPDGRGELRGLPTRVPVSPSATEATAARRLWEHSGQLTGVRFDAPTPAGA